MSMTNIRTRQAVSVIEIGVSIAVLGTLASLAFSAVHKTRQMQKQVNTASQLRQCATAVHTAHGVNNTFPPYAGTYGGKVADKDQNFTFHYHLLLYLEQLAVWQKPDAKAIIPQYLSPQDPSQVKDGAGAANFVVNLRLFYTNGGAGKLETYEDKNLTKLSFNQITNGDGMSRTLLFATKYQICGTTGGSLWLDPGKNFLGSRTAATFGESMAFWQTAPKPVECNPTAGTAVSFNDKFILTALCDGSVKTIAVGISKETWQAAHTYAAGDRLGDDWDK